MKTLKHTCATAALVVGLSVASFAVTSAASAQDAARGPYLSLGAGISMPESTDLNALYAAGPTGAAATTPVNVPGRAEFNTGYNIVGAAGYRWGGGLRSELEFGFRRGGVDSVYGVTSPNGHQDVGSVMANVLYDFNTSGGLSPYIGGGVGAGQARWTKVYGAAGAPDVHVRDTGFQWQAIGGVSYPVSDTMSIFTEYRYISLNNIDYRTTRPLGSVTGSFDDRSHNVIAGVRFNL